MSSASLIKTGKSENIGGRIMIQQEKNRHIERLNSIYASPRGKFKSGNMERKKNAYPKKK